MIAIFAMQGLVEVRFTNTFEKVNLEKCKYLMVETTAYFEAYRHVLEGLQQIDPERIPFKVRKKLGPGGTFLFFFPQLMIGEYMFSVLFMFGP